MSCLLHPGAGRQFQPTKTFCFSFQFLNLRCRLGYYFSLCVCVCVCVCVAKRENKIERHAMLCMFVLLLYCIACHIITLLFYYFWLTLWIVSEPPPVFQSRDWWIHMWNQIKFSQKNQHFINTPSYSANIKYWKSHKNISSWVQFLG